MKPVIDLHKLNTFATVMQQGSVTQAAKVLCMTQPAVSTIIKQIERHYGIDLFDIIGKRLVATPAAELLYQQWQHLDASMTNLNNNMSAFHQGYAGNIRIVMVSSGKYFISPIIDSYLKRHPNVTFYCDIKRREQIQTDIINDQYHLGILTDPQASPKLEQHKIGENPLVFIAPADHDLAKKSSVSLKQLAQYPFIVREENAMISQKLYQTFQSQQLNLTTLFTIDSTEALKQAVIAGLGLALVPEMCVSNEIKRGLVHKLNVDKTKLLNHWYVVYNQRVASLQLMNEFIQMLSLASTN